MKQKGTILIVLVIILIALWLVFRNKPAVTAPTRNDQTVSDSVLTIPYDPAVLGLAVKSEQVPRAYIPACNEGVLYCFYIHPEEYKGTNFESAGVSIDPRSDLATERLCTQTPPGGYSDVLPDRTGSTDLTSYSVFENMSDAAAGHYANGNVYRLFIRDVNKCYEVPVRIAQSRYENYPEGTIKQFTKEDELAVKDKLEGLVVKISYKGKAGLFYSED